VESEFVDHIDFEASYHQERLWFIDTFEKGHLYEAGPVYHNIPLVLALAGNLEIDVLERSIGTVIQRHEALRTQIVRIEEKPVQRIRETVDFNLEIRNADVDNVDKEALKDLAIENSKRPFDLESGELLVRAVLYRGSGDGFVLTVTFHHLVADRYSLGVFMREITACYEAFLHGGKAHLPPLEIH
jgi:syringomycin synthetase protein SyrE